MKGVIKMKYWALDYIDDCSCELVYGNQLYSTKEEAEAARETSPDCIYLEVNWYTLTDLEEDVFMCPIEITPDLRIELF